MLFAREYLKTVTVSEKQVERLATEAARGGCQGHRAELFATRVAKASAALDVRAARLAPAVCEQRHAACAGGNRLTLVIVNCIKHSI